MGEECGHGGHGGGSCKEPTTEFGRAMRDVLNAAPQLVTTLQAKPDDHCGGHDACDGHGEGHCGGHGHCPCQDDGLDAALRRLVNEIRDGLKQMRNPAGVVANCNDALKRLVAAFGEFKGDGHHGHHDHGGGLGHLVAAVLLALAAVAIGFLLFGNHTDVAYIGGSDPDYRAMAYPTAVDTPNLGNWFAWIVLILALAGAVVWTIGRLPAAGSRPRDGEHAGLRRLYDRGLISRDLYDRGRRLASDDPLLRPAPGENYAREYGAYILALADALCHRQKLGVAGRYRDGEPVIVAPSLFAAPAKSGGH